ncbi:methyltransferase domain-containing protein [Priestia aryabhattai]|uniref:class I SAM-dependent methyltransferase n=1 Tax=Priestia aryabhattai TaxID=412384 RepID=UPI001EBA84D7|nr:methyltransferase domain-containing protein [Priestia aryabhattai]MBY0094734.1 methyltransferase domain-containing protein [Priestia aryabhattai]MBY0103591.1 methyltransferase domain-containing protein [Priestia aryabhattai]
MGKKLHLGCGKTTLKEWINLDIMKGQGVDIVADLEKCSEIPLPLEDHSIDEFYASHLIEHIHHTLPMMQELHRVAKNDAKAVFRLPYGSSDDAYEDPTHVRQYFLNSFGYFSQPYYWRADYGYRGDWKTEKISLLVSEAVYKDKSFHEIYEDVMKKRNVVSEMVVELRAIKPIRETKKELQTRPFVEFLMV